MKFKEYPFSELLSNIVDNRGKTCPIQDVGIPLIATNCIKNESLYPVFEKVRYISSETYNNWFRGHPKQGDLIFVCKGSPGRVAWVPDPVTFCIAQDMVAIRADDSKIDPKYLFALLRSKAVQDKIVNMHVGTLIPHFKKGDFKNLHLSIHTDIEYQKKIGVIYFDISKKIESNTKANQTLEQIAQAIFKSWFVDFDPVKAKIAVLEAGGTQEAAELAAMTVISGKDEAQLAQLKIQDADTYQQLAQTAAPFPAAMQESELGEIPESWNISEIGNQVTVVGGGTPSTSSPEFWDGGIFHWTTPKDLSGLQDKILVATDRKITGAGLAKISSGLLPIDTVLMSSRAPVGYLALAKVPIAINQGYIAMKCNKILSPEYVIQWCVSVMDEIKQRSSGTTFAEISKKNFNLITVIVPDQKIIDIYSSQLSKIYKKIELKVRENISLSQVRDSLLPKLLSGEITIPDFENSQKELAE